MTEPKFAAFDVDGTLLPGSISERAFWHLQQTGIFNVDDAELARLEELRSGIDLSVYHDTRDTLYNLAIRGVRVAAVRREAEQVVESVMPDIYPEMLEEIGNLKDQGYKLGLISGTPDVYVQALKHRLGFDAATGTRYFHNRFVYHARPSESRAEAKHGIAISMAESLGCRGVIAAAFGDTMNDRSMLELAELPTAVNPDDGLRKIAKDDPNRWRIIDCAA